MNCFHTAAFQTKAVFLFSAAQFAVPSLPAGPFLSPSRLFVREGDQGVDPLERSRAAWCRRSPLSSRLVKDPAVALRSVQGQTTFPAVRARVIRNAPVCNPLPISICLPAGCGSKHQRWPDGSG